MTIAKLIILASLLTFSFAPAFAGERKHASMRYTTMGHKDSKDSENIEEPEESSEKVWERYKALAAGQHEEGGNTKEEPEAKPAPPPPPQPKLTGLAGLIQQYHDNKKKRGGMKSITVGK